MNLLSFLHTLSVVSWLAAQPLVGASTVNPAPTEMPVLSHSPSCGSPAAAIASRVSQNTLPPPPEASIESPLSSPSPTNGPSRLPSEAPSLLPSALPSISPSLEPTSPAPTNKPTRKNTLTPIPSAKPSLKPKTEPSAPSSTPQSTTVQPEKTSMPSDLTTLSPSSDPSAIPTKNPTLSPTDLSAPSLTPSISNGPSLEPSGQPTASTIPSIVPSGFPTVSARPSPIPSLQEEPSISPSITQQPSETPTSSPSMSSKPSGAPTSQPSLSTFPSLLPTNTEEPSLVPTDSLYPSLSPSLHPTDSTFPSISLGPSGVPSVRPSSSHFPSMLPTEQGEPSLLPTDSIFPSFSLGPSGVPSTGPSSSSYPSMLPTELGEPSQSPSESTFPSSTPSMLRSMSPSSSPSISPSSLPSISPSIVSTDDQDISKSQATSSSPLATLVRDVETNTAIMLNGMPRELNPDEILLFEEIGLNLLEERFPKMDGINFDFHFLFVEDQQFISNGPSRRRLEGAEGLLQVTFRIVAQVTLDYMIGLDFHWFMSSFFQVQTIELERRLAEASPSFGANAIEGKTSKTASSPGTAQESSDNFFTLPVIAGLSMMFAGLLGGMSVLLSRRNNGRSDIVSIGEERLIQQFRSDESEEEFLHRVVRGDAPSDEEGKRIFMSLSNNSEESAIGIHEKSSHSEGSGVLASVTSGSNLMGLDIPELSSVSYADASFDVVPKNTFSQEDCEGIRSRPSNLFDDTRSTRTEDPSISVPQNDRYKRAPTKRARAPSSHKKRVARSRKRLLEKQFLESRKQPDHSKQRSDVDSLSALSFQDIIGATSSLDFGDQPSSSMETVPEHTGIKTTPPKLDFPAHSSHTIQVTPTRYEKKTHRFHQDRVTPERDLESGLSVWNLTNDEEANSIVSTETTSPSQPTLGFSKVKMDSRKSGIGRLLPRFGRKIQTEWNDSSSHRRNSPSQRYRLSEGGKLVPNRFSKEINEGGDISQQVDAEGNRQSSLLGIVPQKYRPPMLNLDDLEDDESISNAYGNVETPLQAHPLPSDSAVRLLPSPRNNDMDRTQEVGGRSNFQYLFANRTNKVYTDPPTSKAIQVDPPTAWEYHQQMAKKSTSKTRRKANKKTFR